MANLVGVATSLSRSFESDAGDTITIAYDKDDDGEQVIVHTTNLSGDAILVRLSYEQFEQLVTDFRTVRYIAQKGVDDAQPAAQDEPAWLAELPSAHDTAIADGI